MILIPRLVILSVFRSLGPDAFSCHSQLCQPPSFDPQILRANPPTSYLDIKDVKVGGKTSKWELASRFEPYGSALSVQLDQGVEKGKHVQLDVSTKSVFSSTSLGLIAIRVDKTQYHRRLYSLAMAYARTNV